MRKLFYMGLESYQERYTYQLTDWSVREFKKRGIDYVLVPGNTIDNTQSIQVGQVLDAHGRSYFAMSQMMNLVQMMRNGDVTGNDVIFFEDMFQPGIESLPYIMNQINHCDRPTVYVRCLAQSIDPDDFVHVWGMEKWMGHFEKMVCDFAFVLATNEEMVAHMKIAGWGNDTLLFNISGLSFGKEEVQSRVPNIKPFAERTKRVSFAARFDQEKQPDFFMDIVEMYKKKYPDVVFSVLSGGKLRSNDPKYLSRAKHLQERGILEIHEGLKKNEYYELLNDTRVLFNCALQDWVSNTVSEADALGSNVLYPAYRSFPETFANDYERLYVPWSKVDAMNKLEILLEAPHKNMGKISDWNNGTIGRMLDIMENKFVAEQWSRNDQNYRNEVSKEKY